MITGFNTDIEFEGVTYHVQTEDKGLKTPLILSLVYDRGTILASKRSPYNDLLEGEFNEKELTERLQKQHKLICAAIRAGRIEDLKRMTMKESAAKHAGLIAQKEVKVSSREEPKKTAEEQKKSVEEQKKSTKPEKKPESKEHSLPPSPPVLEKGNKPIAKPPIENLEPFIKTRDEEEIWEIPLSIVEEDITFDEVQIVEEEVILPAEAVEIITDAAKNEPVDDKLKVEFLDDIIFKSGERKTLSVIVRRGNSEKGMDGAHVMVKVIGSSFRPLIFHAKTDSNGVAIVPLQVPHFKSGRAALLIKAMIGGEEVELRRSIQHENNR